MKADEPSRRQDSLIEEFKPLLDDKEMMLMYLMERGEELPKFPESDKQDKYLVRGCQSRVWVRAEDKNGYIIFKGDSDAHITKGLLSLLITVLSNLPAQMICEVHIFFPPKIGLSRYIGTQRTNGFQAMLGRMKEMASSINMVDS
ncbi:MAG: SufE family protein [Cytophagales bacterium]|nr:SufE family protein [Cytophagales bacterium]